MVDTDAAPEPRRGRPFELGEPKVLAGWRLLCFWLVASLVRLYLATLRIRLDDESRTQLSKSRGPRTIVKWHSFSLVMPRILQDCFCIDKTAMLISASAHGAIQARFYEWYGMKVERGSASRRGLHVLRNLLRLQAGGCDVVLSPDGPSGPRHSFRGGAALLARRSSGSLVYVSADSRWAFRAPTWDRHLVPLPFARLDVRIRVLESYEQGGWENDDQAAAGMRAALLEIT